MHYLPVWSQTLYTLSVTTCIYMYMLRVVTRDCDVLSVCMCCVPQANPPYQDSVEDIVDLTHLNESSVLHVLRQRYGSTLIHTFAGRHLIVLNPLRPLSCYVDRVSSLSTYKCTLLVHTYAGTCTYM